MDEETQINKISNEKLGRHLDEVRYCTTNLSHYQVIVKKVRGRKVIMALNISIIVYMNATDYNRKLRLLLHWNRTEDMFKD